MLMIRRGSMAFSSPTDFGCCSPSRPGSTSDVVLFDLQLETALLQGYPWFGPFDQILQPNRLPKKENPTKLLGRRCSYKAGTLGDRRETTICFPFE